MGRRIYIAPRDGKLPDIKKAAVKARASEISWGIPPRLVGVINLKDLPTVYEEPDKPEAPADVPAQIAKLNERIAALENPTLEAAR